MPLGETALGSQTLTETAVAEIEVPNPAELKEKGENQFTRRIALCVAVYAVGLAIASFGGANAAKEMMLAKAEESNRWNQYQSKSTREAIYKNEVIKLESEKEDAGGKLAPARQKLLDKYKSEEARMMHGKETIAKGGPDDDGTIIRGAEEYQHEVKLYQRKDPYFDFAEVGLQLAIVLASVAMLAEKRWAFLASLALFVVAAFFALNGLFLLVKVPGIEG